MNIFSKISTFLYPFIFPNVISMHLLFPKEMILFLAFHFFPLIISRQQFKGMIQIHLPVPPPGFGYCMFLLFFAPLQIFHAVPVKTADYPDDRPFKQKCRDAGGLCGGYTGSGAGSKSPRTSGTFTLTPSCQMWSDHAIRL